MAPYWCVISIANLPCIIFTIIAMASIMNRYVIPYHVLLCYYSFSDPCYMFIITISPFIF